MEPREGSPGTITQGRQRREGSSGKATERMEASHSNPGTRALVICVPALTLNAAPQIPESQAATAKLTRFCRSELARGY